MFQFKLPDPGEGLLEAEITQWLVAEGDEVRINDVLVEIETAKSLVELPSPVSGTVHKLLVEVGQTVEIGTPIIEIDDGSHGPGTTTEAAHEERGLRGEARSAEPRTMAEPVEASTGPFDKLRGRGATTEAGARTMAEPGPRTMAEPVEASPGPFDKLRGRGATTEAGPRTMAEPGPRTMAEPVEASSDDEPAPFLVGSGPAPEPAARRRPVEQPEQRAVTTAVGKVLAKPLVRRLARDLGVALSNVRPTGPHGTVSKADVEAAANLHGQPATDGRREPIKGVRKVTAQNVADSIAKHVHVTEFNTIDFSASRALIDNLKTRREFRDLKVSPLLLHAKAVCLALARHPELNASWDAEAGQIVYHDQVNLGIAAATPRGLLVPVIKGADKLSLVELCAAINELVVTAREGRLQPADYSGGTFTITNVGVFGVDTGTPIINGDESAILAMGAIKRRPWVVGAGDDERIEPRWVTTLALSFDHQLIDGEGGSQFLADISMVLEQPELALLF